MTKDLEFSGKKAVAQALRCVESQMQALSSQNRNLKEEMRGEIQSSEHNIMVAISNLQMVIASGLVTSGVSEPASSSGAISRQPTISHPVTSESQPPISLPTDETSAKTFIPSADELDVNLRGDMGVSRQLYGCKVMDAELLSSMEKSGPALTPGRQRSAPFAPFPHPPPTQRHTLSHSSSPPADPPPPLYPSPHRRCGHTRRRCGGGGAGPPGGGVLEAVLAHPHPAAAAAGPRWGLGPRQTDR